MTQITNQEKESNDFKYLHKLIEYKLINLSKKLDMLT